MKFEIYQEKPQEQEKVTRFRLVRDHAGDIVLMAVDASGNKLYCGNILWIDRQGRIRRFSGLSPEIGLELEEDSNHRVRVY
ncbi:MAG: hypothetical protein PHV97_00630 [Candidatus Omnitrophica bacterium]|nr:hypothetical protein [Candidatus Omnitrophota bacterium]